MQSTVKQTSYKDVLRELAALKQKMVKLEKELGSLKSTMKPLKFRVVTDQVAKREILEFLRIRPGARTSDIIEALELDPPIVIRVLSQMEQSGKLRSKEIERR
jgi:DNA-binding MarR family transcriptional regulator